MRPTRVWMALLAVAGALAAIAVGHWIDALVTGRPVLYGEGPVANAAILLRDGNPYAPRVEFVAANYPPLYLFVAGLGEPFRSGRLVTIASALVIAVVIWRRAGSAGRIPGLALALAWLSLGPVAAWGAAVKPDLFAVALTLGGVALTERALGPGLAPRGGSARLALAAGALFALAVWAKPTALLPAFAVLAYAGLVSRAVSARVLAGALAVGAVALGHAYTLGIGDVWRHVVTWNALPWSVEQAALVLLLGAATVGLLVVAAARTGAFGGVALAYGIGALGVAVLGGREGSTINYLLDACAAAMFALATVGARLSASATTPTLVAAQVVIGFTVLAPFGLMPGREPGTGSWGHPARLAIVRALPLSGFGTSDHLVEDSGLLVAVGMRPVVDDLFLWSRLVARGTIDPSPVLERVRSAGFATVVSEVDLQRIDGASARSGARWHPDLVRAVIERYEPARQMAGSGVTVYRPR